MTGTIDNLVEQLYSSNDPLCYDAAEFIATYELRTKRLEQDNEDLAAACRLMMECLMEVVELSRDRDRVKKSGQEWINELALRLQECGNVSADTLKLDTVTRAYNGYFYK